MFAEDSETIYDLTTFNVFLGHHFKFPYNFPRSVIFGVFCGLSTDLIDIDLSQTIRKLQKVFSNFGLTCLES